MAKQKKIQLIKPSKIARLHLDQIQPPQLYVANNVFVSRADLAAGIRPDLEHLTDNHTSMS